MQKFYQSDKEAEEVEEVYHKKNDFFPFAKTIFFFLHLWITVFVYYLFLLLFYYIFNNNLLHNFPLEWLHKFFFVSFFQNFMDIFYARDIVSKTRKTVDMEEK
jgi:hypothetical protein